jgi:hypothetical protein
MFGVFVSGNPFQPSLMFVNPEPTLLKNLSGAPL